MRREERKGFFFEYAHYLILSGLVRDDHPTEPAVHPDISTLDLRVEALLGDVGCNDKRDTSIFA